MKAPGGEGIAEPVADGGGGHHHADHHADADGKIAGGLQHQQDHGDGGADNGGGHRSHADQRIGLLIRGDTRQNEMHQQRHGTAEQAAQKQRRAEQAATKAGADGNRRSEDFRRDQSQQEPQRIAFMQVMQNGAMTAAQDRGEKQGDATKDAAADQGPQPHWDAPLL